MIVCLPSKCEVLISIPRTRKRRKKVELAMAQLKKTDNKADVSFCCCNKTL